MTGNINLVFDSLLRKQGIIQCSDVSCVHTRVEDYLKNCSWQDRESIDIEKVRKMIIEECSYKKPDALTDYLRVALGHILLSCLSASFKFRNDYEYMKYAYRTYLDVGYQRCSVENGEVLLEA